MFCQQAGVGRLQIWPQAIYKSLQISPALLGGMSLWVHSNYNISRPATCDVVTTSFTPKRGLVCSRFLVLHQYRIVNQPQKPLLTPAFYSTTTELQPQTCLPKSSSSKPKSTLSDNKLLAILTSNALFSKQHPGRRRRDGPPPRCRGARRGQGHFTPERPRHWKASRLRIHHLRRCQICEGSYQEAGRQRVGGSSVLSPIARVSTDEITDGCFVCFRLNGQSLEAKEFDEKLAKRGGWS